MKAKIKKLTFLFFIANLFISSFYLDNWFNPNSLSRALTTYSVVQSGSLEIDDFEQLTGDKCHVQDHYYSEKAPLPAMLIVPFYSALNFLNVLPDNPEVHFRSILILGSFLCGTLPFSIILSLIFTRLLESETVVRAVLLSTLPIYGSFLWIFAGTFFSHLFSGFLLLLSYLLLKHQRYYFWAGVISGLAFLSEFPVAVIVAVWAVMLYVKTRSVKNVVLFSLGVLPSIVFILIYNLSITGNAFTMLYTYVDEMKPMYGLGIPKLTIMWKLVFSQYRGLLFYMPIYVLFVFLLIKHSTFRQTSFYVNYLILPCLAYFLLFSSYHDWWGGWTYGPRQLVPVSILLVYEGVIYLSGRKVSNYLVVPLSLVGLSMAFLAKSSVLYSLPTDFQWPFFEVVLVNVGKGHFNDGNLLTYIFGTGPGTSAVVWLLVFFGGLTALAVYGRKLVNNSST